MAKKAVGKAYWSVGVEVPPRRGSQFSMRYTEVPSARAGWRLLRQKMQNKSVGRVGELFLVSENGHHTISVGGFIRRSGGELFAFDGNSSIGQIRRALTHETFRAAVRGL